MAPQHQGRKPVRAIVIGIVDGVTEKFGVGLRMMEDARAEMSGLDESELVFDLVNDSVGEEVVDADDDCPHTPCQSHSPVNRAQASESSNLILT